MIEGIVATVIVVADYLIKFIALGTVPENRRPASSQAWLLLILFVPLIGLPLFLLIGSPYVAGRRHRIQEQANALIHEATAELATIPKGLTVAGDDRGLADLNRRLTSFPVRAGQVRGLHPDYEDSIIAIAAAIDEARRYVHLEMYILALDTMTERLFAAMAAAKKRGVAVRVLYDHIGSRGYAGHRKMNARLTADGIEWQRMMPILPLRGKWRRPDLRNHRKLVVIDGQRAFMGSQNMIEPGYLSKKNARSGRKWIDLNIDIEGEIVRSLDTVFAVDWYSETGERLPVVEPEKRADHDVPMQLVPSGPGFPAEPNLRLFCTMLARADKRAVIVSPYFVPDEALLSAITTAALRGVRVELHVSQQADQFMVHHAQRSYYGALLDAGVRIFAYPAPATLHTKFVTVDGTCAAIGSSNMDMRSFALDYEIMLLGFGTGFVAGIDAIADRYRAASIELDATEWAHRPWPQRYLDNVMRLTSALQ